jgi:hypothetical protein
MSKTTLMLRFPKGTAGYGTILRDDVAKRMIEAGKSGALLIHRGNDLFEVFGLHSDLSNWRVITAAIKKHLPEGKLVQLVA